jgi:7-cyano-7-deazaguanine synthase
MCAIIGCILASSLGRAQANQALTTLFERSVERGRDGVGFRVTGDPEGAREHRSVGQVTVVTVGQACFWHGARSGSTLIGNLRAEPTTEYVAEKHAYDQQPYRLGKWTIVHNGTIANDGELRSCVLPTRIDSAAIVEQLDVLNQYSGDPAAVFVAAIGRLHGSYAILATHDDHPGLVFAACNYRPIWHASDASGTFFASARHYFPDHMVPVMVPPYSAWRYDQDGGTRLDEPPPTAPTRALVVCSGGLDSVVAAAAAQAGGAYVTLLHFCYGSRAEGPEVKAVGDVAEALGVPRIVLPLPVYGPEDSPLLREDDVIAGGEAGAEFAHEWVPARNLVMLSVATAIAEARGFDAVVLGSNLEEAGAYPDNEPEFIARFNDLLPFAVADGGQVRVVTPVGNMMKHEIVALGLKLGAPLHLTWSCYRAGERHCGRCGPCHMRRIAFEINHAPEVIRYADEGN